MQDFKLLKIIKNYIFNKLTKNQIHSKNVSLKAIKGKNIKIMGDSHVDADSQISGPTYIGYNCFVTKAVIGKYCSIANNVSIGMGEHDLDGISTNSCFYDNAYENLTQKDCCLGNDVWIGVDTIIRRGVKIGDGAVIGANSFVNKDIPAYAVAVGTPAKIIKYRFSENQIEFIKSSKWWELEQPEAKKLLAEMKEKLGNL